MRVPKKLAIFGFNLCASTFIGLCVYGLLIYSEGGKRPPFGAFSPLVFGVIIMGCIAGICYFGSQWDRRNAEEAEARKQPPGTAEKSKNSSPKRLPPP